MRGMRASALLSRFCIVQVLEGPNNLSVLWIQVVRISEVIMYDV